MLVATLGVHLGKGIFASTGGPELPITNIAVAAAVAVAGPGRYSLDSLLGIAPPEPVAGLALTALTLLGVLLAFLGRRSAPQPAPADSRAST